MADIAFDDFNRANGGLGGNWTTVTGRTAPQIVSQQVQDGGVGATSAEAIRTTETFPDNQYAYCTIVDLNDADCAVGVYLRGITASRTAYLVQILGPIGASATYAVFRINAGSVTTLISSTTFTVAASDVIYMSIVGYVLTVKLNGSQINTYDDSADGSKIASGQPGLHVSVGTGILADAILDDWGGGGADTTITGLRPAMRVPNVLVF